MRCPPFCMKVILSILLLAKPILACTQCLVESLISPKSYFPTTPSKGAIQFPLDRKLPLDLIRRIILFRIEENIQVQETKKNKR